MSGANGSSKPATALLVHASYFLCVLSAIAGGDRPFGCAQLWPANAIVVTTFLFASRVRWSWQLPTLAVSVFVANLLTGIPLLAALGFACANVLEIYLATVLLREARFLATGFTRLSSTVRFVLVCGLLAPLASSVVGAATISLVLHKSPVDAFLSWFAADTLGLMVVIPCCLTLVEHFKPGSQGDRLEGHASSRWERYVTFALFLAMLAWVLTKPLGQESFGLRSLHFVVFGMIWLAVRHNDSLTLFANFFMAVGVLVTARLGLGPFVFPGAPLGWSVIDAQFFVAVMSTAILLVHAVVDERRDAMRDALALRILAEERNALLTASSDALAAAVREAKSASRAKSDFLANMSHEIRTPLTAILGYTELVEQFLGESAGEETTRSLRTIHRNGDHLLQIINDILDLSKIEAEQMDIAHQPISICDLLHEIVRLLEVRAHEKGVPLRLVFLGMTPESFHTDALRLKQVLINLIGNAVKFTDRGRVEVAVEVLAADAPHRIEFRVSDTGIGMSAEEVSRLFRPFSQADTSTSRRFGGTGLGLAISQRISKMLGGDIEVASEPGVGSTFTLRLPLTSQDAARLVRPHLSGPVVMPAPPRPTRFSRPCHVLLAEDGQDNQRLIRKILETAGATVAIADDGVLACEMMEQGDCEPPDVILMDMQMPRLDGYSAARQLRERGCRTPIIALTAHAMSGDREKCLDAGCDDYLTKPITRDRLLPAIEKYMLQGQVVTP